MDWIKKAQTKDWVDFKGQTNLIIHWLDLIYEFYVAVV